MKINAAVLGGFFLAGIICAAFFDEAGSPDISLPKLSVLILEIIWARAKQFGVIGLAAATRVRKAQPAVIRAFLGFAAGVFLTVCVRSLGLKGILFYLAALLPHWGFYILALVLIFSGRGYYAKNSRRQKLKAIARYLGICLVILLGCLVEALMNYYALAFISAMS